MKKSIYSEKLELLCAFLVESRNKAGLTQRELATRLKRPHSYVAKIEIGERRIDVIEFIEICEMIGVEPSQLVKDVQKG